MVSMKYYNNCNAIEINTFLGLYMCIVYYLIIQEYRLYKYRNTLIYIDIEILTPRVYKLHEYIM